MSALRLLNLGCGRRRHPAWTNADLVPDSPEVLQVDLRCPLPFLDGEFDAVYSSHALEHLAPDAGRRVIVEMHRVLRPGGVVRVVVPDLEGICRAYLAQLDAMDRGDASAIDRHAWMTIELVDQLARVRKGGLMLRWWQREPVPAEPFVIERLGAEASDAIAHIRRRRQELGRPPLHATNWDDVGDAPADDQLAFLASGESHRWMYDRLSLGALLERCGFERVMRTSAQESRIPQWGEFALDLDDRGRARKPDSLFMEAIRPGA
ncbi:MAG: methyltransferase domain-containing protein [Phycisphaerales bacterium]